MKLNLKGIPHRGIRNRYFNHVQGLVNYPDHYVISRGGETMGELLLVDKETGVCEDNQYVALPHAGGIDNEGDLIFVPTYDPKDDAKNELVVFEFDADDRSLAYVCSFPLTHRCYAIGVGRVDDEHLLMGIVSQGTGNIVDWYSMPYKAEEDGYMIWGRKPKRLNHTSFYYGARNNITIKRGKNNLWLYSLRAHIGHGTIQRWKIDFKDGKVSLDLDHECEQTNGICSVRFGATITGGYNDEYLVKTSRNIFRDSLYMANDRLMWWYERGAYG